MTNPVRGPGADSGCGVHGPGLAYRSTSMSGKSKRKGLTTRLKNKLREQADWRCARCGKQSKPDHLGRHELEVHHHRRVADGGSNAAANLECICKECHQNAHKPVRHLAGWKITLIEGAKGLARFDSGARHPAMGGSDQGQEATLNGQEMKEMPAGFGADSVFELPAGDYLCQVVDVTNIEFDSRKNPGKKDQKWKWVLDVQERGKSDWTRSDILTGRRFLPKEQIKGPQFVPVLHHLSLALGVPIPTNAQEAVAWDEQAQIGKQFRMRVRMDPHTETLQKTFAPVKQQGVAAAPPPPTPEPAPAQPPVDGDDDDWDA